MGYIHPMGYSDIGCKSVLCTFTLFDRVVNFIRLFSVEKLYILQHMKYTFLRTKISFISCLFVAANLL